MIRCPICGRKYSYESKICVECEDYLKYSGLCVLFDEAEAIHSLSRIDQQERAYENLLRIVTETQSFPYCYFIYSTTPSFSSENGCSGSRMSLII